MYVLFAIKILNPKKASAGIAEGGNPGAELSVAIPFAREAGNVGNDGHANAAPG